MPPAAVDHATASANQPVAAAPTVWTADTDADIEAGTVIGELRVQLRRWVADRATGAARAVVDGTDAGASDRLWAELTDLGFLSAHLPERDGGGGAGLPAAVAVLTELAAGLVPGPILSTVLAGTVLAAVRGPAASTGARSGTAAVDGALSALARGARASVVILSESPDGVAELDLGPVIALPHVDLVVVLTPAGTAVLDAADPALSVDPLEPLDATRFLGHGWLRGWTLAAAGDHTARASELLAVLIAAEAAGLATWCLDTAVTHARTREQFGRPIGSFQAVNHRCVELLIHRDRATALAEAAAAGRPHAAAAAGVLAPAAAVSAANGCIQLLGAIGFTWEHDAQLRLRRALANRQWAGFLEYWSVRLVSAFRADPLDVDLVRVEPSAELRERVAAVAAAAPAEHRRALADSGLLAPSLPAPWGLGAQPREQAAVRTALHDAGVGVPDLVVGTWALATLAAAGTPEQCARFIPPTLRGELAWCQLFSEPEAGSDLAALRTRAEPVEGGWAITGHKIWTSRAAEADWAICLARVPDAGVTFFLVPMHDAQVRVEPLRNLTGRARFAEVFLDGVLVAPEQVIGRVGEGWTVARTTLGSERLQMSDTRFGVDLREIVARSKDAADGPDAATLGSLIADGLVLQAMTARDLSGAGGSPEVRKLVAMAYYQRTADVAHRLLGAGGLAASAIADQALDTRGLSIGGGTTEVLTTVVGERVLGLPNGRGRG